MERDYTFASLSTTSREELEELSMRMIQRLVPEESMNELFTFDQEETESEDKMLEARFDAMLRMSAIALSEVPALFSESDNQAQKYCAHAKTIALAFFYASSFQLDRAIPLETHCNHVEVLLKQAPNNALEWVTTLTDLLRQYAQIGQ
ncbi:exoribonuclease R [Vibrio sinaloensis]|nr:exoribonuclease R [Vibrio sinaloensis]